MLTKNLILGWRNLLRNKLYSLINVLGLSMGISAALIIYLMVQFDYSHDRFHPYADQTYRVVSDLDFAGTAWNTAGVPGALFAPLSSDIKGIRLATPLITYGSDVKKSKEDPKNQAFKSQRDLAVVNPAYFEIFPYAWVIGDKSVLEKPFNVVLTEERARKYFGNTDPHDLIGKTLYYTRDSIVTTISGIIKSLPANTEMIFQDFISYATFSNTGLRKKLGLDSWPTTNSDCQVFISIDPKVSKDQILFDINMLRRKNIDSNQLRGNFGLQALTDIHFDGTYGNYKKRNADRTTSNALILVAFFLLILGCVNFINLSTAHAPTRSKEIGIRKTLGSLKSQLTMQFLVETFLIVSIALSCSILSMPVFLKLFRDFIPEEIQVSSLLQGHVILFFIALIALVTLLGGLYPAMILSGYRPITVLKGSPVKGSNASLWMRKGLTLFQLIIAQVFILGTLLVLKQVNFLVHKDPGFNKEAVINVETPLNSFTSKHPDQTANVFRERLKSIPGISMVSRGSMAPSSSSWSTRVMEYFTGQTKIEVNAQQRSGDSLFFKLYQIPVIAGRTPQYINDSVHEYIINETMAAKLGIRDYNLLLGTSFGSSHLQSIVGICKDFNMKSLHEVIEPMMFTEDPDNSYTFHIRLGTQIARQQYATIINQIKSYYAELFPESEFQYEFVDEAMGKFYTNEQQIAKLIRWCMAMAILICCLGLLGLVIHTAQSKVKEIGVRKVLGAGVFHIVRLLTRDFTWIVVLSIIIATPIVYLLANTWLHKFAYRTEISWWIFPAGGLILMTVTLITLSFKIIQAARANPTKSLRAE